MPNDFILKTQISKFTKLKIYKKKLKDGHLHSLNTFLRLYFFRYGANYGYEWGVSMSYREIGFRHGG